MIEVTLSNEFVKSVVVKPFALEVPAMDDEVEFDARDEVARRSENRISQTKEVN